MVIPFLGKQSKKWEQNSSQSQVFFAHIHNIYSFFWIHTVLHPASKKSSKNFFFFNKSECQCNVFYKYRIIMIGLYTRTWHYQITHWNDLQNEHSMYGTNMHAFRKKHTRMYNLINEPASKVYDNKSIQWRVKRKKKKKLSPIPIIRIFHMRVCCRIVSHQPFVILSYPS